MNFDYSWQIDVIKWMAILCRMSAFFFAMPLFTTSHVPMRFKIAFLAAVSFLLMPVAPSGWFGVEVVKRLDLLTLTAFMVSEAVLGLAVALVFMIITEIFRFGGYLMDQEIGFSMATVMDPNSDIQTSLFSSFLVQVFLIVFLVFDGHQELMRIAAGSLKTLPPGTYLVNETTVGGITGLSARIFIVGLQLALPVMAVNLFLNIALGLMSRIGEDFPVLMLSFALRFGLGFIVLGSMVPVILAVCRNANEQMLDWLAAVARL